MSHGRLAASVFALTGACSSHSPADQVRAQPVTATSPAAQPADARMLDDASAAIDARPAQAEFVPPSHDASACEMHDKPACDRLSSACTGGDAGACTELADVVRIDAPAQARALYDAGCKVPAGPFDGCVGLAELMCDGRGGMKTPTHALHLLDAACLAQFAPACSLIGLYYTEGLCGVGYTDAEWRRGADYYVRGCRLGRLSACTHLGLLVREGHGVAKDEARGKQLLDDACQRGDSAACEYLKSP